MTQAGKRHSWSTFLKFFSQQYQGRKTRIGVFADGNDYWLESGLPLIGIDIDTHSDEPEVEIILGSFTHRVENVKSITIHFSRSGEEDGIDVTADDGKNTILRFEDA